MLAAASSVCEPRPLRSLAGPDDLGRRQARHEPRGQRPAAARDEHRAACAIAIAIRYPALGDVDGVRALDGDVELLAARGADRRALDRRAGGYVHQRLDVVAPAAGELVGDRQLARGAVE